VLLSSAYACTFDTDTPFGAGPGRVDARPGDVIDGGPDADPSTLRHLLLTEVKSAVSGTEFIEIYNPSTDVVALQNYYLADNAAYPEVPTATGSGPKPNVSNSDFIVRFPDLTTINPGEAIVIGVNADELNAMFGVTARFKIGNSGPGIPMVAAFPSSMGSQSGITDSGEGIALFFWDGQSDLVTDVDLVNAGASTSDGNQLADKTGMSQDGPDADSTPSTYQDDLSTMGAFLTNAEDQQSYARNQPEGSAETQQGTGNGRFGHDESSEDIGATWVIIEVATPGAVPATL
jgi:hypothetical protein